MSKIFESFVNERISRYISIIESFLQDRAIKVVLDDQFSTPHDINAGVPLCFWCISMTCMVVPFQELEFMQMVLLPIPAYKHLLS